MHKKSSHTNNMHTNNSYKKPSHKHYGNKYFLQPLISTKQKYMITARTP